MRTRLLLASLWMALAGSANAEMHIMHCPHGCPNSPDGNDLLIKYSYALSNDPTTKFADWVAYEVDVRNFGDSPGRAWKADPVLDDAETLEPDDYQGASRAIKIDRGHQAPLASFAGSPHWSELNVLSNITPQRSALNQGPWVKLEQAVRDGAAFRRSLFVITGPLYESTEAAMPNSEPHRVPSAYWKVIYDKDRKAAGFVMDQELARNADYCAQGQPITEIARRAGLTLPALTEAPEMRGRLGC